MNLDEFLKNFADAMAVDRSDIRLETRLDSLQGWDSMGLISTISLLDEIGTTAPPGALQKSQTVADIVRLAGDKLKR